MGAHHRIPLIIAVLSIILASGAVSHTVAQISEQEAKGIFERIGCTNCHGAGVAPSWDEVLSLLRDWATKYDSIDQAVASEVEGVAASSYAQLMQTMATFSGRSPDDPDVKKLEEFFLQVFQEAGGKAPPAETTTPAETTPSPTTTPGPEQTPQPRGEGITFGEAAVIATLIVVVILVAAYVLSRS